ncbi:MAG TPA: 1,4-dihydroxy-2-naphthoate octaprenyltransferase, partial [Pseudobdellovibrionaceae bacterium]|nr:1,4-dihydroxy-2-naphthoate octaprenyltransferase [Pseudobdellovibrionaceae bacterium]
FGESFVRFEISFLILGAFLLNIFWWSYGGRWTVGLPLLMLPVAGSLLVKIWKTPPSEIYNQFLAQAALLQILFGVLLSLGFYLG